MRRFWWIIVPTMVIVIALGILVYFILRGAGSPVMSQANTLNNALWQSYIKNDWLPEGRAISDPNNSITTSESQSYTMLRSVWENDRSVFDKTWQWTQDNLRQPNGLFAWRWGKNSNGSYGVTTAQNGQNTASDADSDIALALLMAYSKWHSMTYKNQAIAIIRNIWQTEVVKAGGLYYLAADNIEKHASTPYIVINPSYFSPYSYRVFARVDTSHPWNQLANDSYTEIGLLSSSKLGSNTTDGLPPDWAIVNRTTGAVSSSPNSGQTTQFGYNAFRTIWRVALDWQWNHVQAAKNTLQTFGYLNNLWHKNKKLFAIYNHNGTAAVDYSSYALYGGTLPYFQVLHPNTATVIAEKELISPLLNKSNGRLNMKLDYYDNNWVWFGLSMLDGNLQNLSGGIS